jgi:hypothetical protein
MAFYEFMQNNSGGTYDIDERRGIGKVVIIEAESAERANTLAERIGLYWDGVDDGVDCQCCGDRWSPQWGADQGDPEPVVFGTPVGTYVTTPRAWALPAFVHYADGKIGAFGLLAGHGGVR